MTTRKKLPRILPRPHGVATTSSPEPGDEMVGTGKRRKKTPPQGREHVEHVRVTVGPDGSEVIRIFGPSPAPLPAGVDADGSVHTGDAEVRPGGYVRAGTTEVLPGGVVRMGGQAVRPVHPSVPTEGRPGLVRGGGNPSGRQGGPVRAGNVEVRPGGGVRIGGKAGAPGSQRSSV